MKRYALLLVALAGAASCNSEVTGLEPPSDPTRETFAPSLGVDLTQMTRTTEGVWYRELPVGTGAEVTAETDSVFVTYAGYLKDGKLIDSGSSVKFLLLQLIPGMRIGITGMKEGGRRKLVIPSAQGYGGRSVRNPDGSIKIPRQSTLIFDVDLLRAHNPPPPEPTTP